MTETVVSRPLHGKASTHAEDQCKRLARARRRFDPSTTKHGVAVHSVLPGKGRKLFDQPMEDPLPMVDMFVLPYHNEDGMLKIMAAGFNRDQNQFVYDLGLGMSEDKSPSMHRRLSANKNPVLAEEAVDAIEYFLEPHDLSEVKDGPDISVWDAFNPADVEARLIEYVQWANPGCEVHTTNTEDCADNKFCAKVSQKGDEKQQTYDYDVPFRIYSSPSAFASVVRDLGLHKHICQKLIEFTAGRAQDKLVDYVIAAVDWMETEPEDASTEDNAAREHFLKKLSYGLSGTSLEDHLSSFKKSLTTTDGQQRIARVLAEYHSTILVCLPYRPDSKPARLLRYPHLGRVTDRGSMVSPFKSKFSLVRGTSIPPLQAQWQKYFVTDSLVKPMF